MHIGEDVLAADGSRLGSVERLVVDEKGHRVTGVVVGERVVPATELRDAGRDGLATSFNEDEFHRLPDAADLVEAPGTWEPPGGYTLGNFVAIAEALIGQSPYIPPVHIDPGPVHEITEGSPVWSGERQVGRVERVLTDDAGNVTGIVIAREGVLAGFALLPPDRVTEVVGNNVHTDVAEDEPLEEYLD